MRVIQFRRKVRVGKKSMITVAPIDLEELRRKRENRYVEDNFIDNILIPIFSMIFRRRPRWK